MQKSSSDFSRGVSIEGDSAGRTSTPRFIKWGWWYWPIALSSLAFATSWGALHIERQVQNAAPEILNTAGIQTSSLDFNANYRDITITGTLPPDTSATQLEGLLVTNDGPRRESVRQATVKAIQAKEPKAVINTIHEIPKLSPNPPVVKTPEPVQTSDIRISAIINDNNLTLLGIVPSLAHKATLTEAANQAFSSDKITNKILVADQPASIVNADQHVTNFATVLSNLHNDVVNARLNQDNHLLSGNILTTNSGTQRKIQALVASPAITVMAVEAPQPGVVINHTELLQAKFASMDADIREKVIFAPDSDQLRESAYAVLDAIAAAIPNYPETIIEIGGHTDSLSSATYNMALSQRRAESVAIYLSQKGVAHSRLRPIGFGESQPKYTNETPQGRESNRRVEFRAYKSNEL